MIWVSSLHFFQRSTLSRSKCKRTEFILQSSTLGLWTCFSCSCAPSLVPAVPPNPPHPNSSLLVSLCSFPPSVPLLIPSTFFILYPHPPLPFVYFPGPAISSSHWDGCCTRCCSSARVTRGRPHLPLLLFIYSLSSDPTQGSKDGSGHPQIPNMVFSLLHMPWLWRKSIISNLWWWVSLHLPFQPQNSNSWHGFVL